MASLALRVRPVVALEASLDLKDPLDHPDPLVVVDSLDRRESLVFLDLVVLVRRVTQAVTELPVNPAWADHLDCLDHAVWMEALASLDQRERWVSWVCLVDLDLWDPLVLLDLVAPRENLVFLAALVSLEALVSLDRRVKLDSPEALDCPVHLDPHRPLD